MLSRMIAALLQGGNKSIWQEIVQLRHDCLSHYSNTPLANGGNILSISNEHTESRKLQKSQVLWLAGFLHGESKSVS